MRRAKLIMGTGASLDIPACSDEKVFSAVFKRLSDIDRRFSPYKKASELSKYQHGEIAGSQLSIEMKEVIKACGRFEKLTDGYFSANFAGKFDPTGYVKGWAIAEAGNLIKKNGYKTFCVNIGGDVLTGSDGDKEWGVGIQNPSDKNNLTSQVFISTGAVATSGNYERGDHIINPMTKQPAAGLVSFTVTGPDIIRADVFATAGFVMGIKGLDFINGQKNYEAMAIDNAGKIYLSLGMARLLNRSPGNSRT
jgi:FAD:protein FMN transferase